MSSAQTAWTDPPRDEGAGRGFVWLDSATDDRMESLLAFAPSAWLVGNLWDDADFAALESAVLSGGKEEGGLAIGAIQYDGDFTIGIFPEVHRISNQMAAPDGWRGGLTFEPRISREDFCAMVRRAQEYIAAGDVYQVNLSQRFSAEAPAAELDARELYHRLRAVSPAPMAAYLELPDGRDVLSASMETFLRMDGREVVTCPIKGTRPRTGEAKQDAQAVEELRSSAKERAELVMITDLERNDLGQVCEYGSVEVTRFLEIEEYAQVFHQVSEVRGRLRPGIGHLAALRACFPGGSITGAPKKRAREIIAELEPVPRGLYTGAIGYFGLGSGPRTVSQWNIAIRTMVIEPPDPVTQWREAHFHVGAGIVADSDPEAEYQETLDKAAGLLTAARPL